MSCFGCSKRYGLFCKEYGCPNCGYSYCAKCLKRPVAVPKHNNKVMNVCLICYDKLSKLKDVEKVIDVDTLPGTIITKHNKGLTNEAIVNTDINTLLEVEPSAALMGQVLEPISPAKMTTSTHSNTDNSDITENLDCAILKRLKNLKATDPSSFPSDDEIRTRLANLNGMPQKDYSKKDLLLNTDQRSDQEKMNDLLTQFMGETQLDRRLETERNDSLTDIERRLRALRDDPVGAAGGANIAATTSPDTNTNSDNEQDDETILKSIMEKIVLNPEMMAQSKMLMECKVVIKKIRDSVCRMTGEIQDKDLEEVASMLPLKTLVAVQELELKLGTQEFSQAMYLAEARLPEGPSALETEISAGIPKPPEGLDTEELPWCNICNEDAVFRCKGCEGELFCSQCYRECHDDDEEYRAHVKEPYSAPPKFKENHF